MAVLISFSAFFVGGCLWKGPYHRFDMLAREPESAAPGAPPPPPGLSPIITVRTFFPETWIWELVDIR